MDHAKLKAELPSTPLSEAHVMLREGFWDDAKKVARAWLRSKAPAEVLAEARTVLEAAEAAELKLALRGASRRSDFRSGNPPDAVQVLLDRFHLKNTDLIANAPFASEDEEMSFAFRARRLLPEEPRTQLDFLIAIYEMDLFRAALVIGRWVSDLASSPEESQIRVASDELIAMSWIELGHSLEARACLEQIVHNSDIDETLKINAYFLMGLSFEQEGATHDAIRWYHRCRAVDEGFRDVKNRIYRLSGGR